MDEPRFHAHLSGRENLELLASAREAAAKGRVGPSLERVGLSHRADDRVAKYSMGMRQRLGVAACLIGDPQLLILDEPMNGLDPAGMQDMREMILSLVAEGRTVVLSSHLLDEVERTCDAVAIVDRGRVIRQGPIAELLAGTSLVVQIDCSGPDRVPTLLERTPFGAQIQVESRWSRHHAAVGDVTRRDRRDRPPPRGRRHLPLPAPRGPGFSRVMVPPGDEQAGRGVTTVPDLHHP